MSTDNGSTVPRGNKRKQTTSLNKQDKRRNLEFVGEVGLENITENNDETPDESLKKYNNLSRLELEDLCERWMLYDSTGIYVSPAQFNISCQNTKQKSKPKKLVESERKDPTTLFGTGRVGVSHDKFGTRVCSCCNPIFQEYTSNIPSRNFVMACNNNCHKRKPSNTNDNSAPSCSGIQNVKEEHDVELMDRIMHLLDNTFDSDNPLDSSTDRVRSEEDILNVSDGSDTTVINSDIENILRSTTTESVIEFLGQYIAPPTEQNESDTSYYETNTPYTNLNGDTGSQNIMNNSIIDISDVTNVENNVQNIEVVDLTNVPSGVTLVPGNHSLEVIELLDDTLTNLTPNVIETIDLVDSDSESERTNIKSQVSRPSLDGAKVVMECPICLESLKNKKIMTTICGHIFCSKCIRNAIKTKKNCPNCRKKLNSNGIHPIYFNF